MLVKKKNKNIVLVFKKNFLKVEKNNYETKSKLITKDSLVLKTINNHNFILKESE